MRIKTDITGVTTTSVYNEGDCYSLVNLRKKNGTLHPVAPRKIVFELQDEYDIIFIHSYIGYENMIGVKHAERGGSTVHWIADKLENNWNVYENPKFIFSTGTSFDEQVISVQQIGNTLSIITGKTIKYLLYNGEDYIILGEIPEIQPIKWFNYGYYYNKKFSEDYSQGTVDISNIYTVTTGYFNLFKNEIYDKENGCLFDSHLLVFAFRLYDGSYIKQTSPVLLCGNLFETAFTMLYFSGNFTSNSGIGINANKIYLEFDLNYLNEWKDIIKSVDVFISIGLGKCSESNFMSENDFEKRFKEAQSNIRHEDYFSLMNDDLKMIENVKSNSNFYLIDRIPIGTVSTYIDNTNDNISLMFNFPKKTVLDSLDILIDRETLSLDSFSNHTITGNVSCIYNNRLHLAQIQTTLFGGFNINFFTLPERFLGESYYGINYLNYFGETIQTNNELPVTDTRFNGAIFQESYQQLYFPNGILIVVYLKFNNRDMKVYSKYEHPIYFWINPFYSYPDPSAYKLQIYEIISQDRFRLIHEVDLSKSTGQNNSYFLYFYVQLNGLNQNINYVFPLIPNKNNNTIIEKFDTPDIMPSYIEQNKLKVSALNNPFLFPNETTYLVSNGKILNLASIATRISEGQFGQFPLYVFTNKGIYSMSVGTGGVVYSQESAPTSYEVPISDIICSTPFGVVFISDRGVCIISGQAVELLTALLQQSPNKLSIEINQKIDEILLNLGEESLIEYLKTIRSILYNPKENEIILHNDNDLFNWVLNLDSKQFYQSTEKIDLVVQNTFPKLIVIEGNKVKYYDQSAEDTSTYVSLITRPLIYGTTDFKKLDRMFLRATMYKVDNTIILNYYSIDGINFFVLKGIQINPGNRKDFDMGLFSRSKYRQFLFSFSGTLDEKSDIEYLETEIVEEYQNTKMR